MSCVTLVSPRLVGDARFAGSSETPGGFSVNYQSRVQPIPVAYPPAGASAIRGAPIRNPAYGVTHCFEYQFDSFGTGVECAHDGVQALLAVEFSGQSFSYGAAPPPIGPRAVDLLDGKQMQTVGMAARRKSGYGSGAAGPRQEGKTDLVGGLVELVIVRQMFSEPDDFEELPGVVDDIRAQAQYLNQCGADRLMMLGCPQPRH